MTNHLLEARTIWQIDKSWGGKRIPTGGEVHPDLVRFKNHWYCGFKETGRSRLIRSADGINWETVRMFEWSRGFVGRPYLSITAEGLLMVNAWIRPLNQTTEKPYREGPKGKNADEFSPVNVFSVSMFSADGVNWTEATDHQIKVLFSVTWHNSICYTVAMTTDELHYSLDGKNWRLLKERFYPPVEAQLSYDKHDLAVEPGTRLVGCNETALYFDPADDTAYALVRTNPICAVLGSASAPDYQHWTWRNIQVDWDGDGKLRKPEDVLGVQLGCPVVKRLSDGRVFGIGRGDASDEASNRCRLVLFWLDLENAILTPFAKIDDYGGYSGVVEHEGFLWIACSTPVHPAFEVFMLKVAIPGSR